jgi:MFS family permease
VEVSALLRTFHGDTDMIFRWLLLRTQHDRARSILSNYMSTPQATAELQQAFASLVHHSTQIGTSRTLFSKKHTTPPAPQLRPWRRLILACFVQTMRALSGLPTAQFYLHYTATYFVRYEARYAMTSAIPSFIFLFSFIPYTLVDRPASGVVSPLGRRGLLMMGASGLFAIFLLATIVSTAMGSFSLSMLYGGDFSIGLPTTYFVLFLVAQVFYTLGFCVMSDLYTAEIAASNTRIETTSIAVAWGTAVDVGVSIGANFGLAELGAYFFLVWLFLYLLWLVVVFLFYPETQGRSLKGLDGTFARGLKVLAGTDGAARRGRNVGRGVEEFDLLMERDDTVHRIAAELNEEPRGVNRSKLDRSGV